MAHKKGVGSSRNGRESESKRLGIKKFGNEFVSSGSILVRQRGTKYHPGNNVKKGKDDTLFSVIDGYVKFERKEFLELVEIAKPRIIYHTGIMHFFAFDGFVMYTFECIDNDFKQKVLHAIEFSNVAWSEWYWNDINHVPAEIIWDFIVWIIL